MDFFARAQQLAADTVANRRYIHTNAEAGLHHPKIIFNEELLGIGPACYASAAAGWLENHQ